MLDKNGFEDLLKKIEELKKSLAVIRKEKGNAFQDDSNTWHDNFAYEFANYKELDMLDQIEDMLEVYSNAILIERGDDRSICDIGDNLIIRFYDEFGYEDEPYVLVAKNLNIKEKEISINSPIGQAIYKQKYNSDIEFKSSTNNKVKIKILKPN